MYKAVATLLRKESLVDSGGRILLALSGGVDSVVLLHIFSRLASEFPFSLTAAHLDHAIRSDSPVDAVFVQNLCVELNVPLVVERVDVPELSRIQKIGLEEAGRMARQAFLERVAAETNCDVIALAHHGDDQAETFLHRLLRGSGLSGLAAMRQKNGSFIRPLLCFSREEILRYAVLHRLSWKEDPSNRDVAFTRNRIRHELIPLMRRFNPKIVDSLTALTRRILLEEDFWQGEVDVLMDRLLVEGEGGVELPRAGLLSLHPALRARFLRAVLGRVRGNLMGIESVHLEALERLLSDERSQGDLDLPGAWVGRRYERIVIALRPPQVPHPFEVRVEVPGDYLLPCGGTLRVTLDDKARGEDAWAVEFDAEAVSFPLTVRSFRAGDRFRPKGAPGTKKLKDFFIDAKIDRDTRLRIPVVASGSILWIAGLRRCDGYPVKTGRGRVLRLEFPDGKIPTIRL